MAVEGGTRVIKYLLFIFNLLFLLAGLALIIIGAVATAKLSPYVHVGSVSFNGVGVFLIIIGLIVFFISFFGCLGAYKENYCLLVTFIVLMTITLLALIAALIAAFVMRDQVQNWFAVGFNATIGDYGKNTITTDAWDSMQEDLKCCGSNAPDDWSANLELKTNRSVPDSCCKKESKGCGVGQLDKKSLNEIYTDGCSDAMNHFIWKNMIAVGGAAAAIAILMFIGILFASCLAHGIRKSYQVV